MSAESPLDQACQRQQPHRHHMVVENIAAVVETQLASAWPCNSLSEAKLGTLLSIAHQTEHQRRRAQAGDGWPTSFRQDFENRGSPQILLEEPPLSSHLPNRPCSMEACAEACDCVSSCSSRASCWPSQKRYSARSAVGSATPSAASASVKAASVAPGLWGLLMHKSSTAGFVSRRLPSLMKQARVYNLSPSCWTSQTWRQSPCDRGVLF